MAEYIPLSELYKNNKQASESLKAQNSDYKTLSDLGIPGTKNLSDINTGLAGSGRVSPEFNVYPSHGEYGFLPYEGIDNEAIRADSQNPFANLGKGLYNSVLELTLGTLRDSARLLDVEGHYNSVIGAESEFNNWFSDIMMQAQDAAEANVYMSDDDRGFNPLSSSWWANNLPNLATTVSMMIPTAAGTKLLGSAGKALGAGRLLNTVGKVNSAKGLTAAVLSRLTENTAESYEAAKTSYQESYNSLIERGYDPESADATAKEIAGETGRNTWYANSLLLGVDAFQYASMFKSFNLARRAGSTLKSELLKQIPTEAGEEVYQYLAQKESAYNAERDKGLIESKSPGSRISSYLSDPDLYTSALLGGLGGGVFTVASQGIDEFVDPIRTKLDKVLGNNMAQAQAAEVGDKKTFYDIADNTFMSEAITKAREGKLDQFENEIRNQSQDTDTSALNINPDDFRSKISSRLDDVKFVEDAFNRIYNDNTKSEEVKQTELQNLVQQRLKEKRLKSLNDDINTSFNNASVALNLSPLLNNIKKTELQLNALNSVKGFENMKEAYKETLSNLYNAAKAEGFATKAQVQSAIQSSFDNDLQQSFIDRIKLETELGTIKDILKKVETKKGQEEITTALKDDMKSQMRSMVADNLRDNFVSKATVEDLQRLLETPIQGNIAKAIDVPENTLYKDIPELAKIVNDEMDRRRNELTKVETVKQFEKRYFKSVTPDRNFYKSLGERYKDLKAFEMDKAHFEPIFTDLGYTLRSETPEELKDSLSDAREQEIFPEIRKTIDDYFNTENTVKSSIVEPNDIDSIPTTTDLSEALSTQLSNENTSNSPNAVAYNAFSNPVYLENNSVNVGDSVSFNINKSVDVNPFIIRFANANNLDPNELLSYSNNNPYLTAAIEIISGDRIIGFVKAIYTKEIAEANDDIVRFRKALYEGESVEVPTNFTTKAPNGQDSILYRDLVEIYGKEQGKIQYAKLREPNTILQDFSDKYGPLKVDYADPVKYNYSEDMLAWTTNDKFGITIYLSEKFKDRTTKLKDKKILLAGFDSKVSFDLDDNPDLKAKLKTAFTIRQNLENFIIYLYTLGYVQSPDGKIVKFNRTNLERAIDQSVKDKNIMRDINGEPMIFMTAGKEGIEKFKKPGDEGYRKSDAFTGEQGIYFSRDIRQAEKYGRFTDKNTIGEGKDLYYAFLKSKGPYIMGDPLHEARYKLETSITISSDDRRALEEIGFDSVVWNKQSDKGYRPFLEMVVFEPDQIEVIDTYRGKKPITESKIIHKGPGLFNNVDKNKSLKKEEKTEKLSDTLKTKDFSLGYGLQGNIVIPNNEVLQNATSAVNLKDGAVYIPIIGLDGKVRPAKANLRRLTSAEVEYIIDNLNNVTPESYKDISDKINEVTYVGNKSDNTLYIDGATESIIIGSETFRFGDNFNDDYVRNDLSNRLRNVLKSKINGFDEYNDPVTGNSYSNYNDFLSEEFVVTSDLNSQYPFIQPSLHYELPKVVPDLGDIKKPEPYKFPDKVVRKPGIFRRSSATDEKFEPLNSTNELAWVAKNLPFIEDRVQFVDDLRTINSKFGQSAWGLFYDNMIYINRNAPEGTTYHEAFHVVFNLILSNKERESVTTQGTRKYPKITAEEASKLGELYPDLSESEINDIYIEEKLAEDFKRYIINNQSISSLGAKILNFFKRLYQQLKALLSNKIALDEFFYRIDSGIYSQSEKLFKRNINRQNNELLVRQSLVPGFTIKLQRKAIETIDDMFIEAIEELVEQYEVNKGLPVGFIEYGEFLSNNKLNLNIIYDRAIESFQARHADSKGNLPELNQKLVDMFEDMEVNGEKIEGLKTKHKRFLSVYGYNIRVRDLAQDWSEYIENKIQSENEVDIDEPDIDNKERWQYQYFEISGYDKLSAGMKRLVRSLRAMEKKPTLYTDVDGNQQLNYHFKINEFAEYERVNFHETYNFLVRNLAGLDTYADMINEMQELTSFRPEIHQLIDILNESGDDLKSEFYTNFSKSNNKFITVLFSTEVDELGETKKFRVMTSNRKNIRNFIKEEWKNKFIDKFIYIDNNKQAIRHEALAILNNKYKVLKASLETSLKEGKALTDDIIDNYIDVLRAIGINIPKSVFDRYKQSVSVGNLIIPGINEFKTFIYGSTEGTLENLVSSVKSLQNPFLTEDKAIDRLANLVINFNKDIITDSFKNVENKSVYSYNMNTFMTKFLTKIKNGSGVEILKTYLNDPYYSDSRLVKRLINDKNFREKGFDLFVVDGLREQIKGQSGTKYKDFNEKDSWVTKINLFLNNGSKETAVYVLPTPSDNPVIRAISSYRYNENDIVDTYVNQVIVPEIKRIADLYINKIPMDSPLAVKNYIKKGNTKGNGYKLLSTDSAAIQQLAPGLVSSIVNNGAIDPALITQLKSAATEYLTGKAQEFQNKLLDLGIITKDDSNAIQSEFIDPVAIERVYNGSLTKALNRFYINSLIFTGEISRLTIGDTAFYKDVTDASKRSNEINVPGDDLNIDVTGETYNVAILKTEKVDKPAFNGIDYTDAQGYMTLDRYIKIAKATGKYNTKLEESLFKLQSGEATIKDYGIILNPVKGFYYAHSYNEELKKVVPTQIKYSAVPLIPALTKDNPKLDKLRRTMEENGIDEAVFDSAVKAGEINSNNQEDFLNNKDVKYITLSNSYWRWVQNVPEKHIDAHILFGTQIRRLILENVKNDTIYKLKDKELTGREIKDLYQKLIVDNVREDLSATVEEFSDINTLVDMLRDEIDSRNLDDNYEQGLKLITKKDGSQTISLPFNLLTRFEPILTSIFKNGVMSQKTRGIGAVQVSQFGFQDLKYIRNKEGVIEYAECLLPWWTKEVVQPKDIADIDPELLKMVGYRIPTEGKHSMIPLKVVGFLPQESGSMVVLPPEIVSQMGSDFDIDKLYIMLPEFKKQGNDITKIEFNPEAESHTREERDNGILDIIQSILTNPANYNEIVKEGGFAELQKLAGEVRKYKSKAPLIYIDPISQEEFRKRNQAGAGLIGLAANQNTNHALAQESNLYLNNGTITFDGKSETNLSGMYALDLKTLISDNLGQFLAAFVDNAKDPVADDLNINFETFGVAAMIVRAGYSLETASYFISQPILEDYVRFLTIYNEKEAETRIIAKYNIDKLENKVVDLSTETLRRELKDTTNDYQKLVYQTYKQYRKYANSLGLAVSATRADAIRSLPTLAQLNQFLDKVDQSIENKMVSTASVFSEESTYPMVKEFTDVLRVTRDNTARYIPYGNRIFDNFLRQLKDNGDASDTFYYKNISALNNSLISFITTDFDWLKDNTKNLKELLIGEKTLAKRLNKLKGNKDYEDNLFIKLLHTPDYQSNKDVNYITFSGTVGYTKDERNEIIQDFDRLLKDDNTEVASIGKDLVVYSFAVSGVGKSLYSFADFIPTEYLRDIGLIDFQEDIFGKLEQDSLYLQKINRFVEQFIRNNPNSGFVKEVDPKFVIQHKNHYLVVKDGSNVIDTVTYQQEGETFTEKLPKFMVKFDNKLFRLLDKNTFTYEEVGKLVGNEYDINIDNLQSIVVSNNVKVDESKSPVTKQVETLDNTISDTNKDVSDDDIQTLIDHCK